MQSPQLQSLPWGTHTNGSGAESNRAPDQITRQLMPPSKLPFVDDSTKPPQESDTKDHASKNGIEILNSGNGGRNRDSYGNTHAEAWDNLERVASENAVVMFSISSCCVCHVVKRLFSSLGVAPAVYELDQEAAGHEMALLLQKLAGSSQALPAIFIGKKYIGGLEELIAAHIGAALVPQLKQAGALWL